MDQNAELCRPFCLVYGICCKIYDVLIYALYPESFCVENLDIRLFLQNKRIWSESGDKEIHEAANHG